MHFRILVVFASLGIFIICNYYTGAYTSLLSIPSYQPLAESVEDLAYKDNVKTYVLKGSSADVNIMVKIDPNHFLSSTLVNFANIQLLLGLVRFQASTDPTMKRLGDKLRQHPEWRRTDLYAIPDVSTLVNKDTVLIAVKFEICQVHCLRETES